MTGPSWTVCVVMVSRHCSPPGRIHADVLMLSYHSRNYINPCNRTDVATITRGILIKSCEADALMKMPEVMSIEMFHVIDTAYNLFKHTVCLYWGHLHI